MGVGGRIAVHIQSGNNSKSCEPAKRIDVEHMEANGIEARYIKQQKMIEAIQPKQVQIKGKRIEAQQIEAKRIDTKCTEAKRIDAKRAETN